MFYIVFVFSINTNLAYLCFSCISLLFTTIRSQSFLYSTISLTIWVGGEVSNTFFLCLFLDFARLKLSVYACFFLCVCISDSFTLFWRNGIWVACWWCCCWFSSTSRYYRLAVLTFKCFENCKKRSFSVEFLLLLVIFFWLFSYFFVNHQFDYNYTQRLKDFYSKSFLLFTFVRSLRFLLCFTVIHCTGKRLTRLDSVFNEDKQQKPRVNSERKIKTISIETEWKRKHFFVLFVFILQEDCSLFLFWLECL